MLVGEILLLVWAAMPENSSLFKRWSTAWFYWRLLLLFPMFPMLLPTAALGLRPPPIWPTREKAYSCKTFGSGGVLLLFALLSLSPSFILGSVT